MYKVVRIIDDMERYPKKTSSKKLMCTYIYIYYSKHLEIVDKPRITVYCIICELFDIALHKHFKLIWSKQNI